jgi:hypothetical protein
VLRSENLRTTIAVRGQKAVAERYDWTTIGAAFVQHTELITGAA